MAAVRRTTHTPIDKSRLVDELARNRHDPAGHATVESAVRVAGGSPTLGGGASKTGSTSRDGVSTWAVA
jgi:hypothetical protein